MTFASVIWRKLSIRIYVQSASESRFIGVFYITCPSFRIYDFFCSLFQKLTRFTFFKYVLELCLDLLANVSYVD